MKEELKVPKIFELDYYQRLYGIEDQHGWAQGLRDAMNALLQPVLNGKPLRVLNIGFGMPVVATRCAGREGVITEAVGRLVPKEEPSSLADVIDGMLNQCKRYDPKAWRKYTAEHFHDKG
jgi:hypothetical protein